MSRLVLELPDDVATALGEVSRASHRSPEEVAAEMLKKALAVKRLEAIRQDIQSTLGDDAPQSDEEIFKQIS
jgi:hypothetical protein